METKDAQPIASLFGHIKLESKKTRRSERGDLVLDNCAGSGTTGVACKNLNRNYILIEKEPEYIEIIKKRLNEAPKTLF